ncbi:MAG: GDSL-type esterase/lipase family protein [Bacteroidales bacterium]|nr:GDSL-type esterase/lipase family protein [Bacteroidales bacterium]
MKTTGRNLLLALLLAVLSCSPAAKYRSLPEVQAWEKDINRFEELDSTEYYPENSILFMGSSSIRLWSTLGSDMAPYPVIQRGFGGSKLSDFAVYTERIVSPHKCRAIVIFIANDITGSDKDKSPEEVAGLFRYIVRKIRKSHPDTPVFWIAVTPSAARWKVWEKIKEAGKLIEKYCLESENLYYIKTESAFLGQAGTPREELFIKDKLHLNEAGYAIWTDIIKKELMKAVPPLPVETIAHRGASYLAPENTIAAAKLAWELGADAVECDIHLSGDNKIIVCHDANTLRTTGAAHVIKETGSSVLRTLDAGSFKSPDYRGEKLPFLSELIETVPEGKELVVEIKCGPEILPFLKEDISKHGGNRKFVFIAFDFNTISETKKLFPSNPCYWLCSNAELLRKTINSVREAGRPAPTEEYPGAGKYTEALKKQ